jgi:AhpD family alkylhydroperoxidase
MQHRLDFSTVSPELAKKLYELSLALKSSSLGPEILDLANIRASLLNGCAFCVDMHVKEAKIHGERELRVYHIPIWRESSLFTPKERAVLEWVEAVTRLSEAGVPDQVYDRVREHLSEKEISDLTFAVAAINAWNRLSVSFQKVPGSSDAAYGLTKAGLA